MLTSSFVHVLFRSLFFYVTATTDTYTLSLHDALPIYACTRCHTDRSAQVAEGVLQGRLTKPLDRKSTRLNSSHLGISYAVFCLKKKSRATLQSSAAILAPTSSPIPASPARRQTSPKQH